MTLTQLSYFSQVCRHGSISQAAKAMHITQPSISVAIRDLEAEFGIPLFDRTGRTNALTREGEIFRTHADSLLAHADSFRRTMTALADIEVIRLGVPPMIGSLLLPAIYTEYEKAPRQFRLEITEAGNETIRRKLSSYELDLAFLPHEEPLAAYHSVQIGTLETVCCTSLIHPIGRQKQVAVSQLEGEPLVLFSNGFFQTQHVLQRFDRVGITPNILMQSEQLSTIRSIISRNMAIGFLFEKIARPDRNIVTVPLDPPMKVMVSLVWPKHIPLSPKKQELVDLLGMLSI